MPPSNTGTNQSIQGNASGLRSSMAFVVMILGALVAFEIFNFSTTDHALTDLLGDLSFLGVLPWSTILALAFCGIDFAGIARLFTPEQGMNSEPKEVWYLFAAWLLAATMNAILTWWGVAMAVAGHSASSSLIVDQQTINSVVPIFVAIMVWVIRILIIGTLSMAMDRLLHPGVVRHEAQAASFTNNRQASRASLQSSQPMGIPAGLTTSSLSSRPSMSRAASGSSSGSSRGRFNRASVPEEVEYVPEPAYQNQPDSTYHTLSMSARPSNRGSGSNMPETTGRFRRS